MNKAQHTPGPWVAEKALGGHDSPLHIFAHGEVIAVVYPDGRPTADANARLIAAAPETATERDKLREINTELLECLVEIASDNPPCSGVEYLNWITKTRAAIAKARGE